MPAESRRRRSSEINYSKTPKKRRGSSECRDIIKDNSLFGKLVTKAGLQLKKGDEPYILNVNQVTFAKSLIESLTSRVEYPDCVEEFVKGLQNHLELEYKLKWAVQPTKFQSADDTNATPFSQDSLLRMLLNTDELQKELIPVLLEKFVEIVHMDQPSAAASVNVPLLLLSQMKMLDRVVCGEMLCDSLLEVLQASPFKIQQDIITCLPDIVDDKHHEKLASSLRTLLDENEDLTAAVLDAYTNLNLPTILISSLRESMIKTLSGVQWSVLPILVKFILQSTSHTDSHEVVGELRQHLDMWVPSHSETNTSVRSSQKKEKVDYEVLTLNTIRQYLVTKKYLVDAWIKSIDNTLVKEEIRVVDLFVMIMIHTMSTRRRPVESLFRNKIRDGLITENFLEKVFSDHCTALKEHLDELLLLADVLVKSPEPPISCVGCLIYKFSFLYFDSYCKQEVVSTLVAHVEAGEREDVTGAALSVLVDLGHTHASKLGMYSAYLMTLLDHLCNLQTVHVRQVMDVLGALAYASQDTGTSLQDEMHIIIRKQLSNSAIRSKHIGVLGTIMVVRSIHASKEESQRATLSADDSELILPPSLKPARDLLELVKTKTQSEPHAAGLFLDELSNEVLQTDGIDPLLEKWISETLTADFQDVFVVDSDPKSTPNCDQLPVSLQFGLDEESEDGIAVNLTPLTAVEEARKEKVGNNKSCGYSILTLSPLFRLIRICEASENSGSLEGIDALLGCPLYLPKSELFDDFDTLSREEQSVILLSMFHTVNWFREVINAFVTQKDQEDKRKVLLRLKNLISLQKQISKCLLQVPSFVPPLSVFYNESSVCAPVGGAAKRDAKRGRKPAKGKTKSKNKTANQSMAPEDSESLLATATSQADKSELPDKTDVTNTEKAFDISTCQHCLRELDFDVFNLLARGLITGIEDIDNALEIGVPSLEPQDVEFLLTDLSSKLEHVLVSSVSKKVGMLKSKQKFTQHVNLCILPVHVIAKKAIKLLRVLCLLLESVDGYFQHKLSECDNIADAPVMFTEISAQMSSCFTLILQCMNAIFSWNGFNSAEHKKLLKDGLRNVASRLNPDGVANSSFSELVVEVSNYLEKLVPSITSIQTAESLVSLLLTLSKWGEGQILTPRLSSISEMFLRKEWNTPEGLREKGAQFNARINFLVKVFLDSHTDLLSAVETLSNTALKEYLDSNGKNPTSSTYPSINKNTFLLFYRRMMTSFLDGVRQFVSKNNKVKLELFVKWNRAVNLLHIFINAAKLFPTRTNLVTCLKFSQQFVELFVKHAMPLLETLFRSHKEDVNTMLKNLQSSTRNLQHFCSHSKMQHDDILAQHVPRMKRILELLIYQVMGMLALYNCSEAFWMGNLKNRNLHGDAISSQIQSSDSESDEGENDIPEDERSDVELEETNNSSPQEKSDENYSDLF